MRDVQMYKRGQIYWRNDTDRGEGEVGIIRKARPVLLISNDVGLSCSAIATVLPLTSKERPRPLCTQVKINLNGRPSYILCEQIYTCNREELGTYVGTVSAEVMDKVEIALSYALGLEPLPEYSSEYEYGTSEENVDSEEDENPVDDTSTRRRWTDDTKLAFLLAFEEAANDAALQLRLCEDWGFANYGSASATARRFKKQL